jgi:hypothetical protein
MRGLTKNRRLLHFPLADRLDADAIFIRKESSMEVFNNFFVDSGGISGFLSALIRFA